MFSKINIPYKKTIYYNNIEYKYKLKVGIMDIISGLDLAKVKIKIYNINRPIVGIILKKCIITVDEIYLTNYVNIDIEVFKRILISLIDKYNNKSNECKLNWDGCLDEYSKKIRNRNKNIDIVINK